jgi:hypothetical protein
MSVRLFHRGARFVVAVPGRTAPGIWCAVHWRPVRWSSIFRAALALVGIGCDTTPEGLQLVGGSLNWTTGPFWTTIRVQLPPCGPKKAALLTSGLLKAARYADERGV